MRTLAILAVSLGFGVCAFAQADKAAAPAPKDGNFAEFKQQALKSIDEQIADLHTLKNCVTASTDHESMKKCHQAHRATMKGMHKEMKVKMIENKQKRLEQKKQKIQSEGNETESDTETK